MAMPKTAEGDRTVFWQGLVMRLCLVCAPSACFTYFVVSYYEMSRLWTRVFIVTVAVGLELFCSASYNAMSLCAPIFMCVQALLLPSEDGISWMQGMLIVPLSVVYIGVPMSTMLHRYFSHRAFETSRAMQFVFAVVSTLAYQGGPLWWASMHQLHHKNCDNAHDPHSVSVRGFSYAWLGWMLDPTNYSMPRFDLDALDATFLRAEVRSVQKLHPVFPILWCMWAEAYFGYGAMLWSFLLPMLLCRLITCLFNIEFHPKNAAPGVACAARNDNRFLAKLVGESLHEDHHKNPRRSRRKDWDLAWWCTISWMEPLGLVWDCK